MKTLLFSLTLSALTISNSYSQAPSPVELSPLEDTSVIISQVESIQVLRMKDIGMVRVAVVENGAAANPISLRVMVESEVQEGDSWNSQTYDPNQYLAGTVRSRISGDFLIVRSSVVRIDVTSGDHGPAYQDVTLTLRLKKDGKRLEKPILTIRRGKIR